VWYVSSSTDCYVADLDGNGVLVLDDLAGAGSYAYIDQDFLTESAVVGGVFDIIEDRSGSSYTGVEVTQDRSAPHAISYGFNAKTDDEAFVIYWYDTETGAGDSVCESYPFSGETRYNFKLVVDNDANRMHAYLDNRLELSLDLPKRTCNLSSVLLFDKYATSVWDNIYVEETPENTTPPAVDIISPCPGATVSGRFTVEVDVSDTGSGSTDGTGHAALYVNDRLAAVNDSGSCNPGFRLDTATIDSCDCTLTVVAVDESGNSNQTVTIVDINKIPVANFTYSPDSPKTMDTVTFNASASCDPDPCGHIVAYSWNFGDLGYGNITTGIDAMVTHSYATEGYYVVSLTVIDDKEAAGQVIRMILVTAPRGDLNHDGVVTSADAAIVLEMAARGEWSEEADVDDDGVVTSLDALMVIGDGTEQ
jgi:PKD repeat protein